MSKLSSLIALLLLAAVGCADADPGPAEMVAAVHPPREHVRPVPANDAPTEAPPAAATRPVDPVDALLDRLEASAASLEGFTAGITYESYDDLLGRREVRKGELIYRVDAAPDAKRFAVLFDTITRNSRREKRTKHYIFDGQWLAEIDHEARQYIKRQIVPPGKRLDPLKLGEGPFPLPIGQPKAQVLARFEVSAFTPPADGPLKKTMEAYDVDGLLLVPRPGTAEAEDYQRVELLYDRVTLLPVGINAIEINGNRKTVRLADARRNPTLDAEQLAKLDLADPDPSEWGVSIQPWAGDS